VADPFAPPAFAGQYTPAMEYADNMQIRQADPGRGEGEWQGDGASLKWVKPRRRESPIWPQ
jgi:hypothetical protein